MPRPRPVRRRTAVLGVAATVLAAGCDHGDDLGTPGLSASPSTSAEPTTSSSPAEQTPDEQLVDEAGTQLLGALTVLGEARRFPVLRPVVTPLLKAHRRHLQVLELEGTSGGSTSVPANADAALQQVRASEQQLQAALVAAAGQAESGALAKLLASMSASVTQHVAVLPKRVGR